MAGQSAGANIGFEAELRNAAGQLWGSIDSAKYKHVALGLRFLKYISDSFEEQRAIADTMIRGVARRSGSPTRKCPVSAMQPSAKRWRGTGCVQTPWRYVGAEEAEEHGEPFEEKMARLVAQLAEQMEAGKKLDEAIKTSLASLGYPI
ncbi:MAG: type I restriction-modification system subunit M N-terminal domain-containing protein [Fimbriimonas sp.]